MRDTSWYGPIPVSRSDAELVHTGERVALSKGRGGYPFLGTLGTARSTTTNSHPPTAYSGITVAAASTESTGAGIGTAGNNASVGSSTLCCGSETARRGRSPETTV